ncbi:MAG: hypothetical protein GX421_05755 [Caldisericales bacterium]|nr:hypothetical protein [Caldisericales bacterium]
MPKSRAKKITIATGRIMVFLVVLAVLYFLLRPIAQIDYRVANLLIEAKSLDESINSLKNDINVAKNELDINPGVYEKLAREQWQMVHPGEMIYICKDDEGNNILSQSNLIFREKTEQKKPNPFVLVWNWILSLFR